MMTIEFVNKLDCKHDFSEIFKSAPKEALFCTCRAWHTSADSMAYFYRHGGPKDKRKVETVNLEVVRRKYVLPRETNASWALGVVFSAIRIYFDVRGLKSMALAKNRTFTYADLSGWDDAVQFELLEGQPCALAAASLDHQDICGNFREEIRRHLHGIDCKVYQDVDDRIFQNPDDNPDLAETVVRPDVAVVCDPRKLERGTSISGAPDLVIEILSDSTQGNDLVRKFELYELAGVPQYWIADPKTRTVSVFTLTDGRYHGAVIYGRTDLIPLPLSDEPVDLSRVFESMTPS